MKMTTEVYESLKADIKTLANHYGLQRLSPPTATRTLHAMLNLVSHDRAYDDSHPAYAEFGRKRVLPFDGRDYCFYYAGGCNDTHVTTALLSIRKELGL